MISGQPKADSRSRPILKSIIVPIHRAGWPFIGLFAAVAVGLSSVSGTLGWTGVFLTAWCAYFFRDPDRVTPSRKGLIISPADGVVQSIEQVPPPKELDMGTTPRTRVAVFMNVFDVHVNRSPCDGTIIALAYTKGKFFNASLDKASVHNERQAIRLKMPGETDSDGPEIAVVQIAGLIARRIVCDLEEGHTIRAGERIGLIRFGSRLDVYLPDGVVPLVSVGQRAIAGETVLADIHAHEPVRLGEIR